MKKLIALAFLYLSTNLWGFTYHSSTGTFNPVTSVGDFNAFHWRWSDYDHQAIDVRFTGAWTNGSVAFRLAYPRMGETFLTLLNSDPLTYDGTNSRYYATLPSSNIPPNQTYLAEFLYTDGDTGQTRSLAKGKVTTEWSIFNITNEAGWEHVIVEYGFAAASETDPVFSAWTGNPELSYLRLGGTTNVITDDGTNLLRNGVLIAGSGGGVDTIDDPKAEAFLAYDAAEDGYKHVYGPRRTWTTADFTAAQNAEETIYPGQLVHWDANGNVYYLLTNAITAPPFTSTNYPTPLNTAYWGLFVRRGTDGATGATGATGAEGTDGSDGIGDLLYDGAWQSAKAYDTTTATLVRYAGRIYEAIASSTNKTPTSATGTNFWAITVERGASGTLTVVSNVVLRGAWDSGTQYTNLDQVTRSGNLFYVSETNQIPPVGTGPTLDSYNIGADSAYWTVQVSKGDRGATGAKGDDGVDGAVTTNILNISYDVILDTNVYDWVNEADTTNRIASFWKSEGDTNFYRWIADADIVTTGGSGFPLTNDVDLAGFSMTNGFFVGDGSGLTNLNVVTTESDPVFTNWLGTTPPLYSFTETDPVWASWLESTFTNAVDSRIETVGVTGAVTSINGLDGAVTLAPGDNVTITTNANTLTIASTGGGGASSKTLGGPAQAWPILTSQATNVSYATQESVVYLDFNSLYSAGVFVDSRTLLASNVTLNALYLSGRAFGATGSVNVVFGFNSDQPTTNIWHLTTNLTDTVFTLTNSASSLAAHQWYWGITPGTKTSDSVRVRAATLKGVWE
jgi:hypothetical protein